MSKPENHGLGCKNAINSICEFSRKKKHSFIADTKLQVDQIKRKVEAKFSKQLLIWKSNISKSQNDHRFSNDKLDTIFLS